MGYYKNDMDAIEGMKPIPMGSYLVKECVPESMDIVYVY